VNLSSLLVKVDLIELELSVVAVHSRQTAPENMDGAKSAVFE
jgi:hypothetical protein